MSTKINSSASPYNPFSYNEYEHILLQLSKHLPLLDYSEIDERTESFCVIRHDIEFSLERALSLAIIENRMNIKTSYFVQLNNNTYNALSSKNVNIINKIKTLGHSIGLHFTPSSADKEKVRNEFFSLKTILEGHISHNIDRFSFHRPNLNRQLLKNKIKIEGAINVYDDLFFEYFDNIVPDNPRIKYISDSNHKWHYGHPLDAIDNNFKKVQILFHPFSWSSKGGNNIENYISLLEEKTNTLIHSINSEISNFPLDKIKDSYNIDK